MPRPHHLLPLLLLVPVALAGCGDNDVFVSDRPALRLELDEYRITPQEVRIEGQRRLKIVVTNTGELTHNFVLQIPPEDSTDQPEEVEGSRITTTQSGETDETKIEAAELPPGEYTMICTIANHDDLGQVGRLVVEE